MKIALERRYRFSASHLYRRPEWDEAANRSRFGKCANLPGHGHNYRLYVTVRGEIDPETGFIVDLGRLDALVQEHVVERLDHQHLNAALPEFGVETVILSMSARGVLLGGATLTGTDSSQATTAEPSDPTSTSASPMLPLYRG